MAGLPWIPLDVGFPTGEHAVALRVALQEEFAWARVVRVWAWVAVHRADGRIEGPAAVAMIESAAGWTGSPGAFVEALCLPHVGLLDQTDRGFYVHNWHLHCGAHIEKREKDRARHRKGDSENPPRKLRGNSKEEPRNPRGESAQEREREREKDPAPPARLPGKAEVLARQYPATQAVLDALSAQGIAMDHATQPDRRAKVETLCKALPVEVAAAAVAASLKSVPKAWIGWHLDALSAVGTKPTKTTPEPAAGAPDVSWMDSLNEESRRWAMEAWEVKQSEIRALFKPESQPRALAGAAEMLRQEFAS